MPDLTANGCCSKPLFFREEEARQRNSQQWYRSRPEGLYLNRGEFLCFADSRYPCRYFDAYVPLQTVKKLAGREGYDLGDLKELTGTFNCGIGDTGTNEGLWKGMLLTHPPIEKLWTRAGGWDERTPVIAPAGIKFGAYVAAVSALCEKTDQRSIINEGGSQWKMLPHTVDGISGYEMLAILAGDGES